jgi:redox-sensitive bicupin YhaK (pirin superfamily)
MVPMSARPFSLVEPRTRDLGDLTVRRVLPSMPHKMVGPFIFLDHMGPEAFPAGRGIDVRPHPHIGLATVTYLFEGEIVHRDSVGSVQPIAPGDVNWMTAGRGIVHSERTAPELRRTGPRVHGIQTWVALPRASELAEPAFRHHPKAALPRVSAAGAEMRVIAGTAFGKRSPVAVFSPTLYVAAELEAGSAFELDAEHEERGIYAVEGEVSVAGAAVPPQHLAVLEGRATVQVRAATRARVMLLGGARMDGDRFIWWNFVASARELIEEAKQRWREQRFPRVPGETEFVPLPDK